MAIWPLLNLILPKAGQQSFPFEKWQVFFEREMSCNGADPLSLLFKAIQGAKKGKHQQLDNNSLEYAVRINREAITGAAVIGVPRSAATMMDSLAYQRNILVRSMAQSDYDAPASQLALFDAIYPQDVDFNWLAPEARGLLLGVAYRASSAAPIIKPYYTSSLDNTRSHYEIIGAALNTLAMGDYVGLAQRFDQEFSPFSNHRGIGLDLIPGQPPRVKIYQRVDWLERHRVPQFAAVEGLVFSKELWDKCQCFCPNGSLGLTRRFEVALVLGENPCLKTNFFVGKEGGHHIVEFLKQSDFSPKLLADLQQKAQTVNYNFHGLAISQRSPEINEANLYFMA